MKIPNGRENVEIGRITDNTINDQTKKDKKLNNDGQNITEKTKDQLTKSSLKTGVNSVTVSRKEKLLHR